MSLGGSARCLLAPGFAFMTETANVLYVIRRLLVDEALEDDGALPARLRDDLSDWLPGYRDPVRARRSPARGCR